MQHLHAARHCGKTVPAAALQHLAAVIEKGAQHLLQIHHARHAKRVDHIEVERHAQFELGQPEQLFHQHIGIDIAVLRLEHDADIAGGFVTDVGEKRQLAFLEKRGNLFDQAAFLNLIRDLGDNDLIKAVAQLLLVPAGAQAKAAAARGIGLGDALWRFDEDAAGREIGTGQMRDKLGGAAFRLRDQMQQRGADLAGVVRRDARRHADRDAGGAIGEQVGEARRQDDRLAVFAVIGLAEIDRVLIDAVEHRLRHRREAALGVAHRRGIIAIDIAEISLAVDQRITLREILRQAHQRVIHGKLAMRVELADHIADDAGAFFVAGPGIETQFVHRVQDAAMHRLQPIAHIGQRARHDRR